jgi:hypothetical protein
MKSPHLHSHSSHHASDTLGTLARWLLVFALLIAYGGVYWPFGHHAHAAEPSSTPAHAGLHKALYTSPFSWAGDQYRLTIGTLAHHASRDERHPRSRFAALISSHGHVVASCRRELLGELPFESHVIHFRCQGELFGPAAAQAKFDFSPSLDHPVLTLWTSPRAAGLAITLGGETQSRRVAQAR